ncbi:hypothetical protein C9374_007336 [Naegleria lovaniensis]|uniref:Transmembrane protein n=1 Tax=Naegleria lovaniensis TaxID=51637 RepID=A0AA88KGG6_NAELO|nr:uncharacterized protein C9374_007336 [Naegleria lovaniensis]KAG2379197.1 hypothetical protein C9374_007336 [Naegleria lovaniensis]
MVQQHHSSPATGGSITSEDIESTGSSSSPPPLLTTKNIANSSSSLPHLRNENDQSHHHQRHTNPMMLSSNDETKISSSSHPKNERAHKFTASNEQQNTKSKFAQLKSCCARNNRVIVVTFGFLISILPFIMCLFYRNLILLSLFVLLVQYSVTLLIFNMMERMNQFIDQNAIFITKPNVIDIKIVLSIMEDYFKEDIRFSSRAMILGSMDTLFVYSSYRFLVFCDRVSSYIWKPFFGTDIKQSVKWETDLHLTLSILHYIISTFLTYLIFTSQYALRAMNLNREDSFKVLFWMSLLTHSACTLFHTFNAFFFGGKDALVKNYLTLTKIIPLLAKIFTKRNEDDDTDDSHGSVNHSNFVSSSHHEQSYSSLQNRLTVFEWQSLNFLIIFSTFACIAYFAPLSQSFGFYYIFQLVIGLVIMILQFWISQISVMKKYSIISFVVILLSLIFLKLFMGAYVMQYLFVYTSILFVIPFEKFLFKSMPMFVTEKGLRYFAFVWLTCLQFITVLVFFMRCFLFLYLYM